MFKTPMKLFLVAAAFIACDASAVAQSPALPRTTTSFDRDWVTWAGDAAGVELESFDDATWSAVKARITDPSPAARQEFRGEMERPDGTVQMDAEHITRSTRDPDTMRGQFQAWLRGTLPEGNGSCIAELKRGPDATSVLCTSTGLKLPCMPR